MRNQNRAHIPQTHLPIKNSIGQSECKFGWPLKHNKSLNGHDYETGFEPVKNRGGLIVKNKHQIKHKTAKFLVDRSQT